jgi:phytoene synthase
MEYCLDFLSGIMMDAEQRQYKSYQDLYKFCSSVTGNIGFMMAHVLGFQSRAALPYAEKLGVAMHFTNILRDIDDDIRADRLYLPIKEMKQFGVTTGMLINREMNEGIEAFMKFQVKRAHQLYSDAYPGIAMLNPKSRFAIYCTSRIYRKLLFKIEGNHYNPFLGRVYLTDQEKLNIILQEKANHLFS